LQFGHSMKLILAALALVSLAGLAIGFAPRTVPARASSNLGAEPVSAGSCTDRYNSLLKNAKRALTAGDRASTVQLLQRAKRLISVCPALQDDGSRETPVLSLNGSDAVDVRG